MRLADAADRINEAGAEVIAISVDDEQRQAGMRARWRLTEQTLVADPGGTSFLVDLGLYDPEERDGVALPGLLVISPNGDEVYRYQGRDFADRTTDHEMFEALDALGLDPGPPSPGGPDVAVPEDLRGFFPTDMVGPYFRGNMFGALAISRRLVDEDAIAVAVAHRDMARDTIAAWERVSGS